LKERVWTVAHRWDGFSVAEEVVGDLVVWGLLLLGNQISTTRIDH
jgi:hypothetical protein